MKDRRTESIETKELKDPLAVEVEHSQNIGLVQTALDSLKMPAVALPRICSRSWKRDRSRGADETATIRSASQERAGGADGVLTAEPLLHFVATRPGRRCCKVREVLPARRADLAASLPVAYRLYLPEVWTKDRARRKKAGVPKQIKFKTKLQIALEQICGACESGLPRGVALMDAAYGRDARLRAGMTELGVSYVVGIVPTILMWAPGSGPRRMDKPMNNTGRRDEPELVSAKKVALGLPKQAWRTVTWREGSADWLSSRFARVRVRVGYNKLIPEKLSPDERHWNLKGDELCQSLCA